MKPRIRHSLLVVAALLGGCVSPPPVSAPAVEPAPTAPPVPPLQAYFMVLDAISLPDSARQAAMLEQLKSNWLAAPVPSNRLRYALALGAAGHDHSDPVEARRLIDDLLAEPQSLNAEERSLASTLRREFDARVTQYAELARQRESAGRALLASATEQARRSEALSQENARLRRELAQADRKLQAIEEMERTLSEQVAEPVEPAP